MNSAAPLQPQQKCNLILQKASPASFNNPPTPRLWLKAFPSFLMKKWSWYDIIASFLQQNFESKIQEGKKISWIWNRKKSQRPIRSSDTPDGAAWIPVFPRSVEELVPSERPASVLSASRRTTKTHGEDTRPPSAVSRGQVQTTVRAVKVSLRYEINRHL